MNGMKSQIYGSIPYTPRTGKELMKLMRNRIITELLFSKSTGSYDVKGERFGSRRIQISSATEMGIPFIGRAFSWTLPRKKNLKHPFENMNNDSAASFIHLLLQPV